MLLELTSWAEVFAAPSFSSPFLIEGLGLMDDLIPENLRRLLSPLRHLIYR